MNLIKNKVINNIHVYTIKEFKNNYIYNKLYNSMYKNTVFNCLYTFCSAHRKTARDSRVRSLFLVNSNQLRVATQDGVSNHTSICQEDDSEFRDIARRIMSQSANDQQHNSSQPPPYETLSSSNNDRHSPPVNIPAGARASNILPDTFQRSGQ